MHYERREQKEKSSLRLSRTSPNLGEGESGTRSEEPVSTAVPKLSITPIRRSRTDVEAIRRNRSPASGTGKESVRRWAKSNDGGAGGGVMPATKAQLCRSDTSASTTGTEWLGRSDTNATIDSLFSGNEAPRTPYLGSLQHGDVPAWSQLPESALNEQPPIPVHSSRRPFKVFAASESQRGSAALRGRSPEKASIRGVLPLSNVPCPAQPISESDGERSRSCSRRNDDGEVSEGMNFATHFRRVVMSRSGSSLSARSARARSSSNGSNTSANSSMEYANTSANSSMEYANTSANSSMEYPVDAPPPARHKPLKVSRKATFEDEANLPHGGDMEDRSCSYGSSQSSSYRRSRSEDNRDRKLKSFGSFGRAMSEGVEGVLGVEPLLSFVSVVHEDTEEDAARSGPTPSAGSRPWRFVERLSQFTRILTPRDAPRKLVSEPTVSLGAGVIIFDWDDTLLPTSYIKQVVAPSTPPVHKSGPVEEGSPFYNDLVAHARTVEQLLRAASKVATVAIVTLATKWWVQSSADRFLPGLDFERLLSELDLAIYPADRHSAMVKAYSISGQDPCRLAKKVAMSKCLKKIYAGADLQWNVLSVGDSVTEREALKECIATNGRRNPICKTVKIRESLRAAELTKELQLLIPNLKSMVAEAEDFHRTTAPTALGFRQSLSKSTSLLFQM